MVYCGILLYYAYTYSFFVFGANLTILYLFHLPVYGLSTIGLVISCIGLFNQKTKLSIQSGRLKTIIIFYLITMSIMISYLWLNDIVAHLTNPEYRSDTPTGAPPLIIYSLDLGIIIPLMIASAILLYKNSKWVYLLNGIILTKTSMLGFALMAMSISLYVQELTLDYFLIVLWCIIGILGTMLTLLYFRKLRV